mmetsp:Transcript_5023/g.6495  ORF Transcript_5023/g.6495 Transcript_5023/m.6495 type:complete len:1284 (-) Transcript_5023:486-4337(-)
MFWCFNNPQRRKQPHSFTYFISLICIYLILKTISYIRDNPSILHRINVPSIGININPDTKLDIQLPLNEEIPLSGSKGGKGQDVPKMEIKSIEVGKPVVEITDTDYPYPASDNGRCSSSQSSTGTCSSCGTTATGATGTAQTRSQSSCNMPNNNNPPSASVSTCTNTNTNTNTDSCSGESSVSCKQKHDAKNIKGVSSSTIKSRTSSNPIDPTKLRSTVAKSYAEHILEDKYTNGIISQETKKSILDIIPENTPRYLLNWDEDDGGGVDRIKQEVDYYNKHDSKWNQRVILELLYHQIIGSKRDNFEDSDNNGGVISHPAFPMYLDFSRHFDLIHWTKDDLDVCQWEGIYCGDEHVQKDYNVVDLHSTEEELDHEVGKFVFETRVSDCWCLDNLTLDEWEWNDHDQNESDKHQSEECKCEEGYTSKTKPPIGAVTHIILEGHNLVGGTIPAELYHLPFLKELRIRGSTFIGKLPTEISLISSLHHIYLDDCDLAQGIPTELGLLNRTLETLVIQDGLLQGEIPDTITDLVHLARLDLNFNDLSGKFPSGLPSKMQKLEYLSFQGCDLSGTIPYDFPKLKEMRYLNVAKCKFFGTFPPDMGNMLKLKTLNFDFNEMESSIESISQLPNLVDVNFNKNFLEGTLPQSMVKLDSLKKLQLDNNYLTGTLPNDGWNNLEIISLKGNKLTGTVPSNIFNPSLVVLDISENNLTGKIPSEINVASKLNYLIISGNSLDDDFRRFRWIPNIDDVDKNSIQGDMEDSRCESIKNELYQDEYPVPYSCVDFIACSPGTFHENGNANYISGCIKCPSCFDSAEESKDSTCLMYGQESCIDSNINFILGDMDGDGSLSQREVLRLIYASTDGKSWGHQYHKWAQMDVDSCELTGINCKDGLVTKIDLRGATMCASPACIGLPDEIGELGNSLEVLDLSGSWTKNAALSIPATIGKLTNLKILNLSQNNLDGIPAEIRHLGESLQILNLSRCSLLYIPTSIWTLKKLEVLNLSVNKFGGHQLLPFPSDVGRLTNLEELVLSRSKIGGTIPSEIGNITNLKNLDCHGNSITGTIPSSFANLSILKRLDLYNNKLTGEIDALTTLHKLEIIGLKQNRFTGTIPSEISNLNKLSYFDLSRNQFRGTIPAELASLGSLLELYLGQNLVQPPIPQSLCDKVYTNDRQKNFKNSCDNILCPQSQFSENGYATIDSPCKPCVDGKTTLHLGQTSCIKMSQRQYLLMLRSLLLGENWDFDDILSSTENECDWEMVTCDESGEIVTLDLPLATMEFNEQMFHSI